MNFGGSVPLSVSGSKARMKADMMVLRVEHDIGGKKRNKP